MKKLPLVIRGSGGGGKGGGGGGSGATQAPTTLQSDALLSIVEVVSEGEIQGLVNGAQSIFFNQTPLQNEDGSFNFYGGPNGQGIAYTFLPGTSDQDYLPGFSDVESETAVGIKIFQADPLVYTITDSDVNSARVTLETPALTYQDPTTGNITGNQVAFLIEYMSSGSGWMTVVDDEFNGLTTAAYQRSYQWPLTGSAPWSIRVTRLTGDNQLANQNNDLYWSSYTQIVDAKIKYDDCALFGMQVDSQYFGSSIPTRSYELYGLKIQIPSNYDPTTLTYTGVWDGTFQIAYCNNPAWVLYDLLTNPRYGLGLYVDATQVDKYGLYTIAQYCDELVDNGAGGTEPRFTFNYAITSQDKALKVLQYIASCFRGMLYWGSSGMSGIITAIQDCPKDPIKNIANANVIGGQFTYTGTALETRHSAVWVTWNNPNLQYKTDIAVYEDPDLIQLYGYRKLDTVAYGCTSQGQATRFGKWVLETEQNESEAVTFTVGIADADLRPGDIVNVADANYASIRNGGRVVSATTTAITVDDTITIDGIQSYSIAVTLPDGTLGESVISNSAGEYTVLNLETALTQTPNQYAMWVITSTDVAPRPFRVIGVKEKQPHEFEVTAMLYFPGKFDLVEEGINTKPQPYNSLPSGAIAPPGAISIQPFLSKSGTINIGSVVVSWAASPDPRVVNYGLEVITPGQSSTFNLITLQQGLTYTISNIPDGAWSFRVRAFDALNNASAYSELDDQVITISSTPPDDVTNFTISASNDNSILSWTPVPNLNIDHYEIRYNAATEGATWESSIVICDQAASSASSVTVPTQVGTYLIKAVTVPTSSYPSGIYSNDADLIISNVNSLVNFTYEDTITEDPSFPGVCIDTTVTGTPSIELAEISSTEVQSTGTYTFSTFVDLGQVFTIKVSMAINASGDNITDIVDDWTNVDTITNVDGATDGQWQVIPQISTTQGGTTDVILAEDGSILASEEGDYIMMEESTAMWSDYQNLTVGTVVAQAVQGRLILNSLFNTVTPSIANLSMEINMPNFTQSQSNLTLGPTSPDLTGGGQNVKFPVEFRSTNPALAITAMNMGTGDYWTITNKNAEGFNILFFNASGTGQTRELDYTAVGYGYVS